MSVSNPPDPHVGGKGKGAEKSGGKAKKTTPPRPLAAHTPPSKRHPNGKPRCQFWEDAKTARANGREGIEKGLWQCPQAARKNFRACGAHGAGYPKRERKGERQNPGVAAVTTGTATTPAKRRELFESYPELQELFEDEMYGGKLFELREMLALSKVLVRYFISIAKLDSTDSSGGQTPPALAAVDRLQTVMSTFKKLIEIEEKLGPITHEELRIYTSAVADAVIKFVEPDRQADAFAFLRARTGARERAALAEPNR